MIRSTRWKRGVLVLSAAFLLTAVPSFAEEPSEGTTVSQVEQAEAAGGAQEEGKPGETGAVQEEEKPQETGAAQEEEKPEETRAVQEEEKPGETRTGQETEKTEGSDASPETDASVKTGAPEETETEKGTEKETEAKTAAPVKKTVLKLNKTKLTLKAGKTYQLKVKGASGKIKWKSSDKKVARVNSSGLVTARKAGKATITVTVGKKKLTCKIKVTKNPRFTQAAVSLEKEETCQLELKDTSGSVAWKSNHPEIASVSDQGLVTAVKKGTAKIIARVDGKRLVCRVTVTKKSDTVTTQVKKAALVKSKKVKNNPNVFYNQDNVSYKKDAVTINPYYVFIRGGRLYANCYVINGYSTAIWDVNIQKLALWHSDGAFAEASFRNINNGQKIPGKGGKVRWEFVFPAGRFSSVADLRLPLGALYTVTAHKKKG